LGAGYDPFAPGVFPIGVRAKPLHDDRRNRDFTCEIWYPAATPGNSEPESRDAPPQPGEHPLILFSHASGGSRLQSTFLCRHLASHGYVVAALDHSETVAPELKRKENETPAERAGRADRWVANRVPDIRFLLDQLLPHEPGIDPECIGIAGHSFGGWTALATPETEDRVRSIVALAPAGASNPRPGILRATLTFEWGRQIPVLYLVGENDMSLPLSGMFELFERTRGPKQMVILRRADHVHFMDDVEKLHEAVRTLPPPLKELEQVQKEMLPIAELCTGEQAHLFTRALTLSHFDATLRGNTAAQAFLVGDVSRALEDRGVAAIVHAPGVSL
jgi:predicted dienelactone hydrolase